MEDKEWVSELPEIRYDSENEKQEDLKIEEDVKPKKTKKRFDIKNQGITIRQAKMSAFFIEKCNDKTLKYIKDFDV